MPGNYCEDHLGAARVKNGVILVGAPFSGESAPVIAAGYRAICPVPAKVCVYKAQSN